MSDAKDDLRRYLQRAREALVWKLDGLGEYDVRRPMTATGTNLLGLVKHVAGVEAGYLGETFGRPFPEPLPWFGDDAPTNADMWATADESREDVVELYRRVWTHADETVETLPLDAPGRVAWWPAERAEVTLHRVLVHVIAEIERHAGHADIVRETIDGATGIRAEHSNMPTEGTEWWQEHYTQLEIVARTVDSARTGDQES